MRDSLNIVTIALIATLILGIVMIKGDEKLLNILNVEKNEKQGENSIKNIPVLDELNLLKKYLNEDNIEEATKIIESMKTKQAFVKGKEGNELKNEKTKESEMIEADYMFDLKNNPGSFFEMMKLYNYIQKLLSSKTESSEKKMVRTFLRKSFQNMKKNETDNEKKSIEDIIKDTEGHNEMLEKLAEIMKIDKQKLQDNEVRESLNRALIGILKFIDYTNNSNILDLLMDEIKVVEVEDDEDQKNSDKTEGDSKKEVKKKLQVDLSNSKTHLEMLEKASNFMGIDISKEKLKELTSENPWYQNYINQILNFASEYDEL